MKFTFSVFIYFFIVFSFSNAEQGTIDTVYAYTQGQVVDSLLNNPNFPQNIFGIPSRQATSTVPASSLADVESIGLSGEIIVGFKGKVLKNGPGIDFVIFENAFINPVNHGIFAEPGIVSVSQDGINYIEFPYDDSTLIGLAGLKPTYGDKDPFKPAISGGDTFNLDAVGLDYIRYIKIHDTTLIVKYLPEDHKYWNPEFILTGFDLDAIVGLYLEEDVVFVAEKNNEFFRYDNLNNILSIISPNEISEIRILNITGKEVYSNHSNFYSLDCGNFPNGVYFVEVVSDNSKKNYKFLKY